MGFYYLFFLFVFFDEVFSFFFAFCVVVKIE